MVSERKRLYFGFFKRSFFLFAVLIVIAGCTTMFKDMRSWEGHTLDELHWDMGPADEVKDIENGVREFIYINEWTKDGKVHTCRKTFTTLFDGRSETITDTSYEDCSFITVKSR
jgi:hypothetical protein